MAGGSQGVGGSLGSQLQQLVQQNQGGFSSAPGLSNYASPNQNFMQYPQQGQPNQPQGQLPSNVGATPQNQNFMEGVDATGNGPGNSAGFFDNSGSDGGQGGQPAPMQSPFGPQAQGNKPLSMSQFSPQQGLQIQGNPTSQVVQRPQQR